MFSRNKKWIARTILVVGSVALTLLVPELGTHAFNYFTGTHTSHLEFRLSQPNPYRDAHFFSEDFVRESFEQPKGWITPPGTRLILPEDYEGEFFTISEGRRETAFQPVTFEREILVFGGSTVYCSEVPDEHTLPSRLQSHLKEYFSNEFIVRNYGTTSVTTTQQLERLESVNLKAGNVVVFYDGVNDVLQGLYHANPEETMFERDQRAFDEMSFLDQSLFRLCKHSAFIRAFLNPVAGYGAPPHLKDVDAKRLLLEGLARRYEENVTLAHHTANEANATFLHFLQPNLYSQNKLSEYEKALGGHPHLVPYGMALAFAEANVVLQKANRRLTETLPSFDLSSVLDQQATGQEFYLDFCHVNHQANDIIAQEMIRHMEFHLRSINSSNQSSSTAN